MDREEADNVKVYWRKRLNDAPAKVYRLALDAQVELQDNNLTEGANFTVHWDSKVLWVEEAGEPVGFMAWGQYETVEEYFISLAYVAPDHRRKGYHSMLFKRLVNHAAENGIATISTATNVNNVKAQEAFEAQGRRLVSLTYSYDVPKLKDKAND